MKMAAAIVVALLILPAAGLLFVLSGMPNVAAGDPHAKCTRWVLNTAMDRSVKRHAKEMASPDLSDSALLRKGYGEFREMCIACHGAPGVDQSEIGQGLNPRAPELSRVAGYWTPSQLYWIVQHGIKMTGMPGFGKTHEEEEIWSMVAFTKALEGISAGDYKRLSEKFEAGSESEPDSAHPKAAGEHHHGNMRQD